MMPIQPICLSCVMNQCQNYLDRFAPSPQVHLDTMQKAFNLIAKTNLKDFNMPELAANLYAMMDQECNVYDPYRAEKLESNTLLMEVKTDLQDKIRQSDFPLYEALKFSAMGNIIDLGIYNHNFDIQDLIATEHTIHFALDDSQDLLKQLNTARTMVYVFDNAGEAVFDSILIEEIKLYNPTLQITVIVRGEPILNDVTITEVHELGIDKLVDRILTTGAALPGLTKGISKEQDKAIMNADVVLAKGLGNFESNRFDCNIFHLFKVKCSAVSDYIHVPMGELVLSSKI